MIVVSTNLHAPTEENHICVHQTIDTSTALVISKLLREKKKKNFSQSPCYVQIILLSQ